MNLFSVFDPSSYFGFSLNWIIFFFIFLFFPMGYFYMRSGMQMVVEMFLYQVNEVFGEVASSQKLGIVCLCVGTFFYLFVSNVMGLFPFVFTSTAHPLMSLGLGMVMWFSFCLMGWLKNFKMSAAHLVPEGAPLYLSPFMVIIETISHFMRPFTLSIRLAANMMAGHLIISLLASISLMSLFGFCSSFFLQSVLLILEFGVAVIQGFVFSILVLLYALEYY
uniref:ATP synthase subunit a n=1 Tax=Trichonephila clavata TaxID=2740835 RepID=A0A060BJ13_TRICU|nr:ATP synthase F0 subunit 6 [Trichonephila clavata]UQJ77481.1 ATP synthase subunit 6 [Trichonephila clavata]